MLAVNNLRDRDGDRKAGKRTLAVRYGDAFARNQYAVLIVAPALMVVMVALFVPRDAFRLNGRDLNLLLKRTAVTELAFAVLLSVGIILT